MKIYSNEYKDTKNSQESKEKEDDLDIYKDKSKKKEKFIPSLEKPKDYKERVFIPTLSLSLKQERTNFTPSIEKPKEIKEKRFTPTLHIDTRKKKRNFIPSLTIDTKKKERNFKPSLEMPEKIERTFIPNYHSKEDKNLQKKQRKLASSKYYDDKINSKEKNILVPQIPNVFETFLKYTHKTKLIKDLINEFNKSGNWLKNFRPTKTFINFLQEKQKLLQSSTPNNIPKTIKNQKNSISNFVTLITKIRENDTLSKSIRNLITENKGKYNAYNIQKWLLISDTSARNQLKRMFPKEKYHEYIRTQKYVTIKTLKEIAEKKGGTCHTKNIKNAKSKIHLECAEGHHFFTSYDSVVYHGTWCPNCNIYISETICRRFFERIFNKPFPKSYPIWLINENGNKMELDGYNKYLGLAFEYQGIQHRKKAFNMTNDDLKKIQNEDALKLKLCNENKVVLIQIPDDEIVPYNKIQKYIEKEYKRKTDITLQNIPKYDYKEFIIYENKYAKKFRAYVEKKGGTLITPYFSAKKEVTLMCEMGHQWTSTPNSILYRNNWCSECAGNTKGTTEYFRKIGEAFNCELISDYINAKEILLYKCPKGHTFKRSPYWLKRTYKKIEILCSQCKMDIYAEKFQNFISNKKGRILTPYKGRFKPITIKCKNNHIWKTTPGAVYQGNWCKLCKKN